MKKNINVSIGIPAYNESANIKKLLKSLLSQNERDFKISEIIVISDGSTDRTVHEARSISDKRVRIIAERKRMGKSARLAQIFHLFKGDILFLMDADIIITDRLLLSKIIKSGNINKSGLIGINTKPFKTNAIFQKIMASGSLATYEIGRKWKGGNNYLLFKGCFLVLSRSFAKSVKMRKEIVNNDAYLYFSAVDKGLIPRFLDNVNIYFKSPKNLSDHIMQSERFKTSKSEMQKYFKFNLNSEYSIHKSAYFQALIKSFLSNPLYFLGYVLVNFLSRLEKKNEVNSAWNISVSTKK